MIDLAIAYKDRMNKRDSIEELSVLWQEINANRESISKFYKWLVNAKDSQKIVLTNPPV